jgi:hypothetical protein
MSGIKQAIQGMAKNTGTKVLVCKVVSVDTDLRNCDCEPIDGSAAIFDVRMQSDMSIETGLVLTPKKGSNVAVLMLNDQTGVVVATSELEEFDLGVGQCRMVFDADGLLVKSPTSDLGTSIDSLIGAMDKLVDAFMQLQVLDPVSGLLPINPTALPVLVQQKVDLNLLKEQFKTFLNKP